MKIYKFCADLCSGCRQMSGILDKVLVDFPEVELIEKKIFTLGKGEDQAILDEAEEKKVEALPTLIFEKDGKEVDRVSGVIQKQALIDKIKELM
jgi:thioredoxin 1